MELLWLWKEILKFVKQLKKGDYEIACHGLRWIDYQNIKKSVEKKHMKQAIKIMENILAKDLWVGIQVDVVQILEI